METQPAAGDEEALVPTDDTSDLATLPPSLATIDEAAAVGAAPENDDGACDWKEQACRFKTQFLKLREFVKRQVDVRQVVHEAVAGRKAGRLREALSSAACDLLLPIEVTWARERLEDLSEEERKEQRKEESKNAMLTAGDQGDHIALAMAIKQAKTAGCLAEDIRRAEAMREKLLVKAEEERAEMEAQEKVDKAVEAGDVKEVLAVLEKVEHLLPDEKVEAVRKKLPAMQARADLRQEAKAAMQRWEEKRNPEDIMALQCMVTRLKRSALPKDEIEEIALFVQKAKLKVSGAAARAADAVKVVKAPPTEAKTEQRPDAKMEQRPDEQPKQERPKEASQSEMKQEQPTQRKETQQQKLPAQTASNTTQTASSGKREPSTPLELAVASKDKLRIRQALSDLKASKLDAHEILRLHKQAQAEFGT